MLVAQLKYEFNIKYNTIAGLTAPPFNDREISTLLTMAQEKMLKLIISPKAGNNVQSIEEDTLNKDKFSPWILPVTLTESYTDNSSLPNGQFFNLPTDFLYPLLERADITFTSNSGCHTTGSNKSNVKVKPVTYNYYNNNVDNPFKNPNDDLVWRYTLGQDVNGRETKRYELITDGTYTVSAYKLRYIKKPRPIILASNVSIDGYTGVQECELDSFYHRDIVNIAVDDALEIIKDATRFQTFKIQNNLNV